MGLKNILIKSVTLQFIFFLLFSQILIAQNTFHGTIKSEDGQPITSASVILKDSIGKIQIQLLLKLNARKINLYDFIVLLKVLINKDFTYFLPAIMRFEGI